MTQNIKEACEKYVRDNNIPGEYAAYDLEVFINTLQDVDEISELKKELNELQDEVSSLKGVIDAVRLVIS